MSRRIKLRLHLAYAIAVLLNDCKLTMPNVTRYCTREMLTAFRICRDTPLYGSDWIHALHLAREERASRIRDRILFGTAPSLLRIKQISSQTPTVSSGAP